MTELLLKLLGAPTTEATNIAKASLAFRGNIGVGWVIVGVLALGAFVWVNYRKSPVTLPPWRKYTLAALRIAFILLLLVLLLRPVLAFTVEGSVRRLLVLLVDASSSMQIADPRLDANDQKRAALVRNLLDPTKGLTQPLDRSRAKSVEQIPRLELVKAAFKNEQLDLLPRLDKNFDLAAYSFGQNLNDLVARKDATAATNTPDKRKVTVDQFTWVDKLTAKEPVTALGDALREVINRKRGQPLAGIFVVTDGANNSGSQPAEAALMMRQEGLPLYAYGVGITSPRDIIVGNLFAPDVTFVKDELTVTVRVRSQGLSGEKATLVLQLGSQKVAREITFGADGEEVIALRLTPESVGEFDLTASIDPRPDETVKDNNSRTQRIKVIDARIKVLLVDQSPRWEFQYLMMMLLRDRRVDLKCYLVEADPRVAGVKDSPYLAAFPAKKDDLFKYDVVIFGDVDPKNLAAAQLENLNEHVARFGGSLVMIAGKRFAPQAYRRTVFEKMLPVEFEGVTVDSTLEIAADKPIKLDLTSAGRANVMMRLSDKDEENVALWKGLPPVYWVARVTRPKPAAEVLLVDPDPARESRFGKMPVVALQQYGLGQVMFVGTDNLWRWRRNAGDVFHTAIWGQIAQRMAMRHLLGGARRTQLSTDRQNYLTGDRVSVYARLYSAGYDPLQEASLKGIYGLRSGGAKNEATLRPVPDQPGMYRAEFVAGAPGAYQFFIEQDLETPLDFNVTEPKFELGETAMNELLLKNMTTATGGAFFREEDLYRVPEIINAKSERVRSPLEVELWSSPLYFLLMLLVVTAEWVLRKLSYLK